MDDDFLHEFGIKRGKWAHEFGPDQYHDYEPGYHRLPEYANDGVGIGHHGLCNWEVVCVRTPGDPTDTSGVCPDPTNIFNPIYDPHEPTKTSKYRNIDVKTTAESDLAANCPFFGPDEYVCCNADDLRIINQNY